MSPKMYVHPLSDIELFMALACGCTTFATHSSYPDKYYRVGLKPGEREREREGGREGGRERERRNTPWTHYL